MDYYQLLNELHRTEPQPNPNYWELVSKHAQPILLQVAINDKQFIAEELGMSASKFSAVLPILKALAKQEVANEQRHD